MASKYDGLIDEVVQDEAAPPSPAVAKYGDLIDEVTSTAPLESSLFGASGVNPDQEAKNQKLSRELETPVAILPADAEQQAQLKRVNAESLKRNSPATANFLTNEGNAKLTGLDGVDSLAKMEAAYKTYNPQNIKKFIDTFIGEPGKAAQRLTEMKKQGINLADELDPYARKTSDIFKDPLKAAAAGSNIMAVGAHELGGMVDVIPRLVDLMFPTYGKTRREANTAAGIALNEGAEYWQSEKSPAMQKLNKEFEQAGIVDSVSMLIKHPQLTVDMLSVSTPYLIPGTQAAKLGPTAMAGFSALTEAGDAANTARQEAVAAGASLEDQDKAATIAAITAAPLAFLGNKLLGVGKLEADFFTKGTIGDTLLKAVVREAISGSIEEGANKFGTNVGANVVYDDNRQLLEGVGKAAVIGGILESTHAVGMSTAERALRTFVKDVDQSVTNNEVSGEIAAQATAAHDTLENLGAQVAENDLRERSPEAFRNFVETMTDEQELQDVYVDGKTMLAAIETDYVALKQQIPDVVARIEEAAALGNDVQLPVADYLTYIAGTPLEANVLSALKAEPDGVTYKEAQEFYKSQTDLFQSEVEKIAEVNEEVLSRDEFVARKQMEGTTTDVDRDAGGDPVKSEKLPDTYDEYVAQHKNKREVYARDVQTVEDSLYTQFAEAKRFTPSVNRAYVAPLVEFYKTQAKKLGIQPSELLQQYPLKIQAFLNLTTGFELNQGSGGTRLEGLPDTSVGPDAVLQDTAVAYMNDNGWAYFPQTQYVKADPERGARIAAEYEKMVDNPSDPEVAMAYQALAEEVMAQYQSLKDLGYTFDLIPEGSPDPYAGGPREALLDMKNNKHLWVFPTVSGFGQGEAQAAGSPMLAPTNEYLNGTQLLVNDVFRIVHDVFGHAKDGFSFGPTGEENAWQSHVRMFTPVAARAMTTETRGQNSWVNFGPHGEANRANQKQTIYAEQKIGLLPDWVLTEGLSLDTNPAGQVAPIDQSKIGVKDQTQTEAFKNWFGDSKVVDANGKPLVVYHGTNSSFDAFSPSRIGESSGNRGFLGSGFYFSGESETANAYADEGGGNVVPVFVKLSNPLVIGDTLSADTAMALNRALDIDNFNAGDELENVRNGLIFATNSDRSVADILSDGLQGQGFDGVIFGDFREVVAFEPTQIKSAIGNNGQFDNNNPNILFQGGKVGQVAIKGVHYSPSRHNVLNGSFYGRGTKGAEADRVRASKDGRIKSRLYFYVDEGKGVFPEYGVGNTPHTVTMTNMYDAARNPQGFPKRDPADPYNADGFNLFESAVLDAGFDGYYVENGFGRQGVAVMLGDPARSVVPDTEATMFQTEATFYSALTRAVEGVSQNKASAAQWKGLIKNLAGVKAEEIEAVGVNEWLGLQTGTVTKEQVLDYLNANGVQVEEVINEAYTPEEGEIQMLLDDEFGQNMTREEAIEQLIEDEGLTNTMRYSEYTVAGGENYKELLLTLPEKKPKSFAGWQALMKDKYGEKANFLMTFAEMAEGNKLRGDFGNESKNYKSSHFDQANILAHVRFDERTDADGNKVLFINEIQSDWAQEGKKKGFKKSDTRITVEEAYKRRDEISIEKYGKKFTELEIAELRDIDTLLPAVVFDTIAADARGESYKSSEVPTAPFVQKTDAWVALALKRMMRYAAENGFDKVAIINGQQAADLYDLSKQVDHISAVKMVNGYHVEAFQDGIRVMNTDAFDDKELTDLVGKDLAEKISKQNTPPNVSMRYEGVDLKVGGEGMRTFYDTIVPKVAKDVLKKVGGQVETVAIPSTEATRMLASGEITSLDEMSDDAATMPQLGFNITPDMKAKIQSGLPLFQGTRGSFNLETLTMTMLQGADLSTVIHESGHFYLKMLETLAARTDAPQEVKADYQKTLDWFGVSDMQWRSMGIEQQRPYHEQWAESFERWNLEGKAPTQALQPIFSRFRAWLLSVYKSVEEFVRLNPGAGKLNDEVRGVFSRLLAAEEAITATENARAYQPLYATAEEAGVSQEAFQNYINLGQDATQDAQDELQSRSLRDMKWLTNARNRALKELQATAKAVRAKTTLEVAREVADEPVYQAMRFLRRGETRDPNTGDTIKIAEGYKLDKAILAEMYPETALDSPDLAKLRGMTMTDGLSPDIVAQMFGLTSGDALVRELIAAENMNDKIEGLTDQRMLEEHGDLVDERSVQRAADEAVHNEARARFMATGLKMLSKSPISVSQLTKAAKQAAENVIANKRVRDIKPKQFLAAETRANKEVMKLVATKPNEAIEQQRVALLNNRLASAAHDAVTEVEKDLRYLGKFNNEGTRKNLDIEYLEQIDALLEPFDLRKGLSLSTIDARTTLTEWVAAQEAMGFEPTIDPAEVAEAKQKSYKNMKMSEMRALVDTIKQIEHMGRMKKKLLTAMEKADFLERINEAKLSIALNANRVVTEKGTPSDAVGQLGQWVRQMFAAHRKFTSYMRELDGALWNGALYNLLIRPMAKASSDETQMKAEAAQQLALIFEPIRKKISSFGNLYNRRRVVKGTTISMTHEQRVMFAMNWGNEGNRQRLLDGGITGKKAMSQQEARAVLDTLTKEEWDFVQNTWDFIATYRPLIEAQERELTGKTPEWVEPAEVETKFGTYKGGYFPAKYDAVLSTRSDALEAVTDLRSAMKGAFGSSAARNGYTKARAAQVVGRPLLLNFNAIPRHINEVVHRLAWQSWLIDANRVVRALDADFRTHLGAEATKEIGDAIRDIALGDAPANTPVEVALNRVRTGTSIVGMGWSISTALLQPSGLSNSIARVGPRHMATGLARSVANPLEMSDWVNANSTVMRNRGRTMNREMNEILNTVRTGKGVSALTASFFYLIGKAQRMVDVPTYIGAYERALEEMQYEAALSADERATIEKKAHDIAGQTVIDTQGGGEMKDLAKVQRGSPIYKLFTNFYSYMSTVYNQNVEAYRTTKFTSPVEVAMFTAEMILINFVPVAFSVMLKNALKGNCEWDDTECLLDRYKSEQVSHLFGQMVGLREIGVSVDAMTGGQAYGYTGPAGLRFFADVYKTAEQLNQGVMDMAAFKAMNNALGALFHYPASQMNKTIEAIIAIENGEVEGMAILPALIAGPPK